MAIQAIHLLVSTPYNDVSLSPLPIYYAAFHWASTVNWNVLHYSWTSSLECSIRPKSRSFFTAPCHASCPVQVCSMQAIAGSRAWNYRRHSLRYRQFVYETESYVTKNDLPQFFRSNTTDRYSSLRTYRCCTFQYIDHKMFVVPAVTLKVTQGHRKWHHSIDSKGVSVGVPQ